MVHHWGQWGYSPHNLSRTSLFVTLFYDWNIPTRSRCRYQCYNVTYLCLSVRFRHTVKCHRATFTICSSRMFIPKRTSDRNCFSLVSVLHIKSHFAQKQQCSSCVLGWYNTLSHWCVIRLLQKHRRCPRPRDEEEIKYIPMLNPNADFCLSLQNKAKLPFWKNGTEEAEGWQHGWHGYDNEFVDMRGFFLAQGPGEVQQTTRLFCIIILLIINKYW